MQFVAIAQLVGMGISAYGKYQAGVEQEKAFRQRADVLDADALEVEKAGREGMRDKFMEGKRLAGAQRVQIAKGGVKASGTPLLVLAEARREIAKDASLIMDDATRAGSRMTERAEFERKMGKSSARAGRWGAGTSLMTGGASFAKTGHEYNWWRKEKK